MNNKKQTKIIWATLAAMLVISLIAGQFVNTHIVFSMEGKQFFYAWFSVLSCVVIVIIARFLGLFLKRRDSYYQEAKK
jgi:hypothetical protein